MHLILAFVLVCYCGLALGRAAPEERVIIALQQRNLDLLESRFWAIADPRSPLYRKFLSHAQLTALTGASLESVKVVRDWLQSQPGLVSVEEVAGGSYVRASFEAGTAPAALPSLLHGHAIKLVNLSPPSPAEQQLRSKQPFLRSGSSDTENTPAFQRALYGVPAALKGTNASHSQMVWGTGTYGFSQQDLSKFYSEYNVAQTPGIVTALGYPGVSSGDNFGEGTLDTQYVSGIAPGIRTFAYNSNNSASTEFSLGFGPAMTDFIVALAGNVTVPAVLSISLGSLSWASCNNLCLAAMRVNSSLTMQECIDYASSQFQVCMFDDDVEMTLMNTEFLKLGARGVSIVAATGDGGCHFSFGPFPGDPLGKTLNTYSCQLSLPTFPSTSGLVTAVGGMMNIATTANKTAHPVGCDVTLGCIVTGGGGFSWQFPVPGYQAKQVAAYLELAQNGDLGFGFNRTGRAYPDVVTIATDVPIVLNGQVQPTGGTSAAAPEFAGLISLINDALLNAGQAPLGFLNTALYLLAEQEPAAFVDVTEGSTRCGVRTSQGVDPCCQSGFAASPGWDAMSGLGMPRFPVLLEYLGPKQRLRKSFQ